MAPPAVRAAKRTGRRLNDSPSPMPIRCSTRGRCDEARAVAERRGFGRQLDAVAVAVQQREQADQRHAHRQRRPRAERHQRAEHHDRERDADLDPGQRHAAEAQRGADRHHHRERQRQQPQRPAAELRRPEADRHHRQHVVEAAERMQQAFGKAHVRVVADMRERRGAEARGGDGGERNERDRTAHGVPHGRTWTVCGLLFLRLPRRQSAFQSTSMNTVPPSTVVG